MTELGLAVSPVAVARHYGDLLHGFILDDADAELAGAIRQPGLAVATTQTVMASAGDKTALARFTLDFALSLPTG
jgi:LPPG:FO 2-phospho-L-lactate transferase